MSRWRLLTLAILIVLPVLFLLGAGAYYLWQSGWSIWVGWAMLVPLIVALYLGHRWQKEQRLLQLNFTPPLRYTDRDKQAWQLIEARAKAGAKLDPDKLSDVSFYVQTAQDMALELARFYHPGAADPIASLTIPEMLAVVELAARDLAEMVDQYLPGGHLLTVRDWRNAKKAADWYQTANNVYWAISSIFSPVNTALRYAASKVGVSRPFQLLQQNLLLWFYGAFVQRLGTYLIDLNSGRLRVGAKRYRELMAQHTTEAAPLADGTGTAVPDAAEQVRRVTLTTLGQVKAGKSSLINALLGEEKARVDVVPATSEITRYELHAEGITTRLVLLDTVGYAHTGPKEDQLKATQEAARDSDLLLLVMHARNPARQGDLEMLQALRTWFLGHPELTVPPILGVLPHIDLLSPSLEWDPPYDWQKPTRPKEQQMSQALATVREQLGEYLAGVVPVCTAPGKVYGIQEWLLPAVAELLDQAHAVALLRCLRAETDTGKVRKVFHQLLAIGKGIVQVLWQGKP
jgi:predicted GTPase